MSKISGRYFLAAAVLAGTTLVATAPAAAVVQTFATFSASTLAKNYRLVNSGNSAHRTEDATVYTTSTGNSGPGAAKVKFSYLIPALTPFVTDVDALYTLNGTIAKNSPIAAIGPFDQTGFSGTFSFLTTTAITVSGPGFITHTYAAGSNLLSGVFSGGTIVGNIGGTSGASFASGLSGTTISFTSDFLDFSHVNSLDRATSLTATRAPFSKHLGANGALSSFRAVTGGQFSSDPVPIVNFTAAVPEPASWALMMVGFGLVGVSVRRRQRSVVA